METEEGREFDSVDHKDVTRVRESADNLGSDDLSIGDNLELVYQFIFDPRSNFSEITKLWSLTNLSQEDFTRLISIARTVRILDKKSFYHVSSVEEWTGEYLVDSATGDYLLDDDGKVIPEMVVKHRYGSRFINMIQRFKGEIDAICAGAGGRNASLIKGFRTAIHKQEQQIEDKTSTKRSFWSGRR